MFCEIFRRFSGIKHLQRRPTPWINSLPFLFPSCSPVFLLTFPNQLHALRLCLRLCFQENPGQDTIFLLTFLAVTLKNVYPVIHMMYPFPGWSCLFTCPYDLDPLFSGISNFIPLISSYKHQQSLYILQRPSPLKPLSNFLIKEFAFTTFVGSILTHSSTHCDLATIPWTILQPFLQLTG